MEKNNGPRAENKYSFNNDYLQKDPQILTVIGGGPPIFSTTRFPAVVLFFRGGKDTSSARDDASLLMTLRQDHWGETPQSTHTDFSLHNAIELSSRHHRLRRRPPPRLLLLLGQPDYPRGLQAPLLLRLFPALGAGPHDEEEGQIHTSQHPPTKHKAKD